MTVYAPQQELNAMRLATESKAGATGHVHEPASNTAAVVTLAKVAAVSHVCGFVAWSYDGDPTGGSLTIADGASTIFKVDIPSKGVGSLTFRPPLKATVNTNMVFTLAAGGAGVSGIVSVHSWTE